MMKNSSTFNGILSEFEKDKKTILAKIPDMIVGQKINEEAVARFLKAKEKLLDVQKRILISLIFIQMPLLI